MKDICQAVYEKLCSDNDISRAVNCRIYPIVLPEDAPLPAIVYAPVFGNRGHGVRKTDDAIRLPRYDIQESKGIVP